MVPPLRSRRLPPSVVVGVPSPWRSALSLAFLLGLVLCRGANAVVPQVRDIAVVDADADLAGFQDPRGGVFLLQYDLQDIVRIGAVPQRLVDPVAVLTRPNGHLLLADANADPLGLGMRSGAVWDVDPKNDLPTAVAEVANASPLFVEPSDLLQEPEGTVLMVDRDADPSRSGSPNGAVFRLDPATNSVVVVAVAETFRDPRCLAWDLDGSLLVVDQTANPLGLSRPAGALYRVNRHTGAVSVIHGFAQPQFAVVTAVAVIPEGPHAGDYLVTDKDADPELRGTAPGAVFRIPRAGGAPVLFSAHSEFLEPIDLVIGSRQDVIVLDRLTNPQNHPANRGAVFALALEDAALLQRWAPSIFKNLTGLIQIAGPHLGGSQVLWRDEDLGLLRPGDFVTVRALIRNSGTLDAPEVSLRDTLHADFTYVVGSESLGTGTGAYDPATREVSWNGSLARGEETAFRFRLRVNDNVPLGQRVINQLVLRTGVTPTWFTWADFVQRDFARGARVFAESATISGNEVGRLYRVLADTLLPAMVWDGAPLRRPSDLALLDNGRIAILDRGSTAGSRGAVFYYSSFPDDSVLILAPLEETDGFVEPHGITVDKDGALLVIDRDANPRGYPAPDHMCGAVFRLDPVSGRFSAVASDREWKDPVDAVMDPHGTLMILDPGRLANDPAVLWEIPPGDSVSTPFTLPPIFFKDPVGLTLDRDNNLFIADPSSPAGGNGTGGAILAVRRNPGGQYGYNVVSADTALVQPADLAWDILDNLVVTDLEADPAGLGPGDRGAVFQVNPVNGEVEPLAAAFGLRRPDGLVVFDDADLRSSRISVVSVRPNPVPGDSLRFTVDLINTGRVPATRALATFQADHTVQLTGAFATSGEIHVDLAQDHAAWSGRIAYGDTVSVMIDGRVDESASYGEFAGGEVVVDGGLLRVRRYASLPIQASFAPGDLVLADDAADPRGLGGELGAIFRLDGPEEGVTLITSQSGLVDPGALEWSASGNLLIAASRGPDPGLLYQFNTTTGTLQQAAPEGGSPLRTPTDMLWAPNGDLLIVDADAEGPTPGSKGGIFIKRGSVQTPIIPFCVDSLFRSPAQATFGPGGLLYLADREADPGHVGGVTGAIFTIDPADGRVLGHFQAPPLTVPTGVMAYRDSLLLVTSMGESPDAPQWTRGIYEFNPRDSVLVIFLPASEFRAPSRVHREPDGNLLILDRLAGPNGHGAVFSFLPGSSGLHTFATCDSFANPVDLVQKPGPLLTFASYQVQDLNGAPLHPADQVLTRAVLRNLGPVRAREVAFLDTLPGDAAVLGETVFSSSGVLEVLGENIVHWAGEIAPGDSVVISFEAQLNPALSEGEVLVFRAHAQDPVVGRRTRSIREQTMVSLQPRHVYLVDSDMRPPGNNAGRGALLKIDMNTGATVMMFTSEEFRRLKDVDITGATQPQLLLLDAEAIGPAGRGAIFRFDPATRDLSRIAGHATWVSPEELVIASEDEAYVFDPGADPFDLRAPPLVGPGAVYHVDLRDGTVTPVFSDTALIAPTSIALLRSGALVICDADADPGSYGSSNGALYTIDLETRGLELFAISPLWRNPVSMAATRDGGLLLADRDATPYQMGDGRGSVHRVSKNGISAIIAVSPFFRSLSSVGTTPSGEPFVSDPESDPFGFGGSPGALLRFDNDVIGKFIPVASSSQLRTPAGFFVFDDLVPAGALEAAAAAVPDGIELRWSVPESESGSRFLVYRRDASGPDDPGDAAPTQDYDLVSGGAQLAGGGAHTFVDAAVEGDRWYAYLIAQVDPSGSIVRYSAPMVVQASATPQVLRLLPAVPSPFQGSTRLRYVLPQPGGKVDLRIFDVSGRVVRSLVRGERPGGVHEALWDGRDDQGHRLAAGLYFCRLRAAATTRTTRLLLLGE